MLLVGPTLPNAVAANPEIQSVAVAVQQSQSESAVVVTIDLSGWDPNEPLVFRAVPIPAASTGPPPEIHDLRIDLGSQPVRLEMTGRDSELYEGILHLPPNTNGALRLRYQVNPGSASPNAECFRTSIPLISLAGVAISERPDAFRARLDLFRSFDSYETFPTDFRLSDNHLEWTLPVPPSHLRIVGCDAGHGSFASSWLDRLAILVLTVTGLTTVWRLRQS